MPRTIQVVLATALLAACERHAHAPRVALPTPAVSPPSEAPAAPPSPETHVAPNPWVGGGPTAPPPAARARATPAPPPAAPPPPTAPAPPPPAVAQPAPPPPIEITAQPPAPAPPAAPTVAPAEHGGVVAVPAALSAEVVTEPNGRVVVYARDPRGAPLDVSELRLSARGADDRVAQIATMFDPTRRAFVGRLAGAPPGSYRIEIGVKPAPNALPAFLATPPVPMTPAALPRALHGGNVQAAGDVAVEVVPSSSGEVALYFTDLAGAAIPPEQVQLRSVEVADAGRTFSVPVQPDVGRLVARAGVPLPPWVTVTLPEVLVRNVRYTHVVAAAGARPRPLGAVGGGVTPRGP